MMEWFQQDGFHYFFLYFIVLLLLSVSLGLLCALIDASPKPLARWLDPLLEVVFAYNAYVLGLYFFSGFFACKALRSFASGVEAHTLEEAKEKKK
jgi:hypothetical protein